ncbi:MAG: 4-hydroxythreonine-4-phosphate dehydrogenase PdxA [Zoogloeaceae bacterium]|jgi:4-hydroxythreonine-4-phosphate dehydrogenase|nr:4-hydroxythreonine-4-phosphate dehydrogenase PdxA [Zoogloeaceae bacterium]
MTRPSIAVTSGEPAGVGPELCLMLAANDCGAHPVVLADRNLLLERARRLNLPVELRDYVPNQTSGDWRPGVLDILHRPLRVSSRPGHLDPANSAYVLDLLDAALEGCRRGAFAAMTTAPAHKGVINEAGIPFTGHTEYLADKTHTSRVVMMLAGDTGSGALRVALATTHLPLHAVARAITPETLTAVITILHLDLQKKYGIVAPRILVAGLNPHAGEGGHLGKEEIEVMVPTLEKLRGQGMTLIGPLPADTLFIPSVLREGDAVLAMYHDQGLAPLKYATFGKGINVTLGLPIIRTSVDHGTALDLAGSGHASPESLFAAVREAARMGTDARQRS